tara:strand:- start:984 stop:1559 length:576 start_codon:yes stop_codon:yes gene_type:complete
MWRSDLPSVIAIGTTVKWRDEAAVVPFNESATSSDWTLTYYLRTNVAAGEGHTVAGSAYSTGWEFTISASDSAGFDAGDWTWEALLTKGSEKYRLGYGEFEVKQTLSYTGTPVAIDNRTQNEKDRDNIEAALRKFEDGAQEYSIGNRTFKRVQMKDLRIRLSELKAVCFREKTAALLAQGLGNPRNLHVRF